MKKKVLKAQLKAQADYIHRFENTNLMNNQEAINRYRHNMRIKFLPLGHDYAKLLEMAKAPAPDGVVRASALELLDDVFEALEENRLI